MQSVQYALQRIGVESVITDDKEILRNADKVILPGVGHANAAMQYLREKEMDTMLLSLKQPVLGICLGLQLLCNRSAEGDTHCLGVFDTMVKKFLTTNGGTLHERQNTKVPQIGWNNIYDLNGVLFKGVQEDAFVYLLHSYYAGICEVTIAKADYLLSYSVALQKANFYGLQFHPEKSGMVGETILKNFINIK